MEWFQFITLMATLIGCVFAFYKLTRDEISVIRQEMNQRDVFHREDMKGHKEDMKRMDEKWERLFEKLLLD